MNTVTETTAPAETTSTPAVTTPKAPSKKSLAQAIFNAKLTELLQGLFASNKEFRSATLAAIEAEAGVTRASASTMYNSFKIDAEAAGTVKLGRDPKVEKVKVAGTGKRGRPAKAKVEAAPEAIATAPAADEVTA